MVTFLKTIAAAGLTVIMLSTSAVAKPLPKKACDEFQAFVAKTNSKSPRKIDKWTEIIQMTIICEARIMTYNKRLLAPASILLDGWQGRKQRQHNQLHCNKQGLASKMDFVVIDNIYDKDYSFLVELKTRPSDCAR